MKAWKVSGVLALGYVTLAVGAAIPTRAGGPGETVWLSDYEAARTTARQNGKPLFVVLR